jgi:hypothetical protein
MLLDLNPSKLPLGLIRMFRLWLTKLKTVVKEDLASWVFLVFKKTLIRSNICKGFKTIRIWTLNLAIMERKM